MSPHKVLLCAYHGMARVTTHQPLSYPDLLTWRRANRFNQRQAARLLGISQTYYGRLERREQVATGRRAKTIMAVTGVPLAILVGAA